MVAVFFGFASGDLVDMQQMGFGLGVAVLIDATVVRTVLVPASMKLLGTRNWYLPRWLRWLPDVRVEGSEGSTDEQATTPTTTVVDLTGAARAAPPQKVKTAAMPRRHLRRPVRPRRHGRRPWPFGGGPQRGDFDEHRTR
jgi:hypothetical protein